MKNVIAMVAVLLGSMSLSVYAFGPSLQQCQQAAKLCQGKTGNKCVNARKYCPKYNIVVPK